MASSDKFDRTIPLNCPTCGGTEFEYQSDNDDTQPVKCPGCGLTTTKAELIASNSENIAAHMDEIKEQLLKDVTQSFKDAFKGNKYITIK